LHAWMTHASLSLHFTCMKSSTGNLERHCLLFVLKKVGSMMASEFRNSLPTSLRDLKNENAKFKVVLRIYLNIHYFYSVDEFL
jgi:hypothetical protein